MTVEYYTHVRFLGDGTVENPNRSDVNYLPEIDDLLLYLTNNAGCVDLSNKPVAENLNRERWFNTSLIAFNKYVCVIHTSSEDDDFDRMHNSFSGSNRVRPFASSLSEYVANVQDQKQWFVDQILLFNPSFDINNILAYIENFAFVDEYYSSIQSWMIDLLNNNNVLYPVKLLNTTNNLWNIKNLETLYHKLSLEESGSDINLMFLAFKVNTLQLILEVV